MKKGLVLLLSLLMLILMVGCSENQAPEDANSKGTKTTVQQSTTLATNFGVSSEGTSVPTESTSETTTVGDTTDMGSSTVVDTSAVSWPTTTATTMKKPTTATSKPTTITSKPTTPSQPENTAKLHTLNHTPASIFIDGVMLVKNNAKKIGMINSSGKLLVDYKYDSGLICVGGYVVFDKQYVYDKTGKLVFEDKNATIENCGNGVVLLMEFGEWEPEGEHSECGGTWNSRMVYKKLDGTVIYSFFDGGKYGQFNKQGYAWLCKSICPECWDKGGVEIINMKGEVINSFMTGDEINDFFSYNTSVIGNNNWILDNDGYLIIDDIVRGGACSFMNFDTVKGDIFDSISISNPNMAVFHAAIDNDGQYCFALDSLSVLSNDESYYLFDVENYKTLAEYPLVSVSASKYILVQNSSGKWGYIDRTGKEYKFYDDATHFDDGYAMVKMDGLLYVVDEKFNIVSEGIEGDSASACCNKYFSVSRGKKSVLVKFEP